MQKVYGKGVTDLWELFFEIGEYEIWRHKYDGSHIYKAVKKGSVTPFSVSGYHKLSTVLSQINR